MNEEMTIRAGSSGFSYKSWKGSFYPQDIPQKGWLAYYASKLPTVEINSTFYRMPRREVLQQWAEQVPAGFRFVIKASRRITHIKRLADTNDLLAYLLDVTAALGDKLGPLLFQLPPDMRQDCERLQRFLDLLPRSCRAAFEFRHPSWFEQPVFDALSAHNVALCVADVDEASRQMPRAQEGGFFGLTDWGYLRLRRADYSDAGLARWRNRIGAQSWSEAYVLFKHDEDGVAPRLACRMLER